MRDFDIGQLRTFVAVAESGSLAAASVRVCLSQSAVSEQIRKIEDMVGTALFHRSKRGAATTPAGERLLGHARRILALSETALRDMRGNLLAGELRLGITDYFHPAAIARMLKRLNDRYPHLRLHVTVMKSALIQERGIAGDFDLGLVMRIRPPDEIDLADGSENGWLVGEEGLAWVTAHPYRQAHRAPWPLVVLPASCALHQYATKLLDRAGVAYVVAHTASGVAGIQLALSAGLGVSCLNESALLPGMARLGADHGLPSLPRVEFRVLPPKRGEDDFIGAARDMLVAELSAGVEPLLARG